mmetsp:Transcript_36005/g.81498  ORF Transcript_36005/g.81498 Transcript_36005/m.81498 type:complete len:282 (-) Transcript_36005:581-1426(-)
MTRFFQLQLMILLNKVIIKPTYMHQLADGLLFVLVQVEEGEVETVQNHRLSADRVQKAEGQVHQVARIHTDLSEASIESKSIQPLNPMGSHGGHHDVDRLAIRAAGMAVTCGVRQILLAWPSTRQVVFDEICTEEVQEARVTQNSASTGMDISLPLYSGGRGRGRSCQKRGRLLALRRLGVWGHRAERTHFPHALRRPSLLTPANETRLPCKLEEAPSFPGRFLDHFRFQDDMEARAVREEKLDCPPGLMDLGQRIRTLSAFDNYKVHGIHWVVAEGASGV